VFSGSFKRLEEKITFSSMPLEMDATYLEKQFVDFGVKLQTNLVFPDDVTPRNVETSAAGILQSLCHCDYPQPPDADLIAVDDTYTEGDKYHTNGRSTEVLSNQSRTHKSLWKRMTKCVVNCIVYAGCRICCWTGFLCFLVFFCFVSQIKMLILVILRTVWYGNRTRSWKYLNRTKHKIVQLEYRIMENEIRTEFVEKQWKKEIKNV